MLALVPVIVCIVGLLVWALAPSSAGKLSQAGYVLFCVGAFFTVWALARVTWKVF